MVSKHTQQMETNRQKFQREDQGSVKKRVDVNMRMRTRGMHLGVFGVRGFARVPSPPVAQQRAAPMLWGRQFAFCPCRSVGTGMLLGQVPAGRAGDGPRGARAASGSTCSAGMCSHDCLFSFSRFALLIFLEEAPQDALSLLLD